MWLEPPRVADRLLHRACAQAACDPRLLAEKQPEAPVHHVVVVDDQHAELAAGAVQLRISLHRAAPPTAPAICRRRARQTRRTRPAAAPRTRPSAAPCRSWSGS